MKIEAILKGEMMKGYSLIQIIRLKYIDTVINITKRWCWADMVTWALGWGTKWGKSTKCGYCRACFSKKENEIYFQKINEMIPF